MMVVGLLLAQLVLPGPLSGPIQPPGMICLGECAGPVVWGPAERGRLVVACDMTSDTCSDGRKITTTRATPVTCEVAPGVWEMVGVDEGCYSVRGLESWAQTTSYLAYGAELDNPAWREVEGGTVEVLPDGYRIRPAPGANNSGVTQSGIVPISPGGETRTLACIVRTHRPAYIRFWVGGSQSVSFPVVDTGGRWEVLSATREIPDTSGPAVRIGGGPPSEDPVPFDVKACWLTRSDTPGRPCWGGEAPVTCAGDWHTISTEGWPTESGEISLVYTPQGAGIGSSMYLAATTAGGTGQPSGFYLYRISATGALVFGLRRGDTISAQATQNLAWENGRSYHVRVRWSPERAEIWRDGVRLRSWVPTTVPDSHPDVVHIGTARLGGDPAQGSIRSLTVRSYEEVSP